eukprot:TRINITY_DN13341_c0_g2_i2.p1 TRINITY_DN13341_c0_g2~~TRINITY_DN13341_c0_g2_i2.p1  ORF type:complete len:120 (+),score=25.13 TRINITY_DN13341_c0_g2_i2:98-457(+)
MRNTFDHLRKQTNYNQYAISEMAYFNKSAEKHERRSLLYAGGFLLTSLYCTKRLFRFHMLTPAGRLASIFGLGFSIFAIPYMLKISRNGYIRRQVENLEAQGKHDEAEEFVKAYEDKRI